MGPAVVQARVSSFPTPVNDAPTPAITHGRPAMLWPSPFLGSLGSGILRHAGASPAGRRRVAKTVAAAKARPQAPAPGAMAAISEAVNKRLRTKTVEVEDGDTLSEIAMRNNITIATLNKYNPWIKEVKGVILVGDKIVVPVERSLPPFLQKVLGEEAKVNVYDTTPQEDARGDWRQADVYYTVQSGDTLWEIAQAYDLSVSELRKANFDLQGKDTDIYVDMQLNLPPTWKLPSEAHFRKGHTAPAATSLRGRAMTALEAWQDRREEGQADKAKRELEAKEASAARKQQQAGAGGGAAGGCAMPSQSIKLRDVPDMWVGGKVVALDSDAAIDLAFKTPTQDTILIVYAPWCPYCKRMEEEVNRLARGLAGDKSVRVAKFRGDLPETRGIARKYLQTETFPTVLSFPARGGGPIVYTSDTARDANSLLSFLNHTCRSGSGRKMRLRTGPAALRHSIVATPSTLPTAAAQAGTGLLAAVLVVRGYQLVVAQRQGEGGAWRATTGKVAQEKFTLAAGRMVSKQIGEVITRLALLVWLKVLMGILSAGQATGLLSEAAETRLAKTIAEMYVDAACAGLQTAAASLEMVADDEDEGGEGRAGSEQGGAETGAGGGVAIEEVEKTRLLVERLNRNHS